MRLPSNLALAAASTLVLGAIGEPLAAQPSDAAVVLTSRIHIFAHPSVRDSMTTFFTSVLGSRALSTSDTTGGRNRFVVFVFPDHARLSVEFTDAVLDRQQATRGAWLELASSDPAALKQRILDAGMVQLNYPGNDYFYFQIPGGQVMRVVSSSEIKL